MRYKDFRYFGVNRVDSFMMSVEMWWALGIVCTAITAGCLWGRYA